MRFWAQIQAVLWAELTARLWRERQGSGDWGGYALSLSQQFAGFRRAQVLAALGSLWAREPGRAVWEARRQDQNVVGAPKHKGGTGGITPAQKLKMAA